MIEFISDYLDPEAEMKPPAALAKGEESTGVSRVVEALECNTWENMIKGSPKKMTKELVKEPIKKAVKEQIKEPEETKAPSDPLIGCEHDVDEFESLMEQMLHIKELYPFSLKINRNKNATREEKFKNAADIMGKFAKAFGVGAGEEDPYEITKALEDLEKGEAKVESKVTIGDKGKEEKKQ